jgi:hypothetical protein
VWGQGLHVVGDAVGAPPRRRVGFGGPEEHPARPRGGAQVDRLVLARRVCHRDDVAQNGLARVDLPSEPTHPRELGEAHHRPEVRDRVLGELQEVHLGLPVRVA